MSFGNTIAEIFGRSPIKPLQMHFETVHECVSLVEPFLQAVVANDWENGERIQKEISDLERKADDLKREFRVNLPPGLFLPMPRADLLDFISIQDKVANKAKDIAGIMLGRRMQIPPPLAEPMLSYTRRAIDTSSQALKAINELDELLATGFGGNETRLIKQMVEHLDEIEAETDAQQIAIRAALFKLEKDWPPVDVIFLYKVIDWIGDLADRAQQVGGYLHRLVAR